MIPPNSGLSFSRRVQVGCVAGLVGGFAIFVSIFVIDLSMGANPGTFYRMVGFSAGITGMGATLFGMVSHMLTAALIGTIFGIGSGMNHLLNIGSTKKGMIAGIVTSLVVFLVFFVPITMLVMVPLLQSGNILVDSNTLLTNTNLIMIGALELHVVYGVVMGAFFAIATQYEIRKSLLRPKVV